MLYMHAMVWNSGLMVLWKYTLAGRANFSVALVIQLLRMQTISDPRGATVRGRRHQWLVRCQTRARKLSLRHNLLQ